MKVLRNLLTGFLLVSALLPSFAYAQGSQPATSAPPTETKAGILAGVTGSCWEKGTCTLCDILVVLINVANTILRVFAILATVFFIWGAGYLMLSHGNENMVSKGKGIIRATIIGSLIVLFAWQLMNYVVIIVANQSIFSSMNGAAATQKKVPLSPLGWYDVADQCVQTQK